ncbi:aquaporin-like protein [Lophiostoma macrostomum CBS 122681]|uniref:Aquaporin-like protein n=1 Tax=Lophiostoma macrostomum CBS 122681 TaxID=1314788 RepID=A0A6A6TTB2_9PLEO|nr:aquaporin-like protein [Lophiostoma macrostomum CBS 122681]
MQDGTIIQAPRPSHQGSRDALLRLPIQQSTSSNQNPEIVSPVDPSPPGEALGIHSGALSQKHAPRRIGGEPGRHPAYSSPRDRDEDRDRDRDYYHRSNRYDPYASEYRGPYVEEYFEEEERPRVYRRPSRRHVKPPLSHHNFHSRYSQDDSGRSMDYDQDTPTKPRVRYDYDSPGDDGRYGGPVRYAYPGEGGGGGRGPPRRTPSTDEVLRLPWTMWMNSNAKNHFVAFVGEFVGTTMFLFFAFAGTQVANIGSSQNGANTTTGADTGFSPSVLQYISLVFAFSLMVNVWIFFRISGGLFNPAVTFAMLLTKAMTPIRFFLLLIAQLAGSIFSSFLVSVMFPTQLNVRTTLSVDTSLARGVFIEAVLTAELVFTIFMLAKEKHKATFIAPVGIGLALFIAELVGVYYTGGSLNPARSFGPCVVTGVFDQEHWIYWVGPGIGAILAVAFYKFIKILEYEMANPDQDADDKDMKEKAGV